MLLFKGKTARYNRTRYKRHPVYVNEPLPQDVARFCPDDVHCGTRVVEAEVFVCRVGVRSSRLHSTEQLNMLFMCFVHTWRLRLCQRHCHNLTLHQWRRKRKHRDWV